MAEPWIRLGAYGACSINNYLPLGAVLEMQNKEIPAACDSRRPWMLTPRMHYGGPPVTAVVDPVFLVISECIAITSALQKHARSLHSSVAAILGGSGPRPIELRPLSRAPNGPDRRPAGVRNLQNNALSSRWGLRGQKGKSLQDNPLMSSFGKLRHGLSASKGTYAYTCMSWRRVISLPDQCPL